MLSDLFTYDPIAKDPTAVLRRRVNALLLSLRQSNHISQQRHNRLRCSAGCIPLFYALPKIHNPETPLRPILSLVSSPTYQLSKHLTKILAPLVGNTENKCSQFNQLYQIHFLTNPRWEWDIGFLQLVSLFTKVPVDLAIQVASQRLQNDTFLDRLYVTNVNWHHRLAWVLPQCHLLCIPQLLLSASTWHCALKTELIKDFHHHLKSMEPRIQFTLETENNSQLAFLDVLITQNRDQSIDTTVHRKLTHTNKYLDFSSHHPLAHKITVVRTLYSRALVVPSL